MQRSRPGIKVPKTLERLGRELPEADRVLAEVMLEQLTLPEEVAALAAVPDSELLDIMHTTRYRVDIVRSLQKLGVSCPNGRLPRNAGLLRMRLQRGLSQPNGTASVMLLQITDPVMVRLIAQSSGLPSEDLTEPARLDTYPLRALAVATAAPRNPSLPLVLMGLAERDDAFLSELLDQTQRDIVSDARRQISDDGWLMYRRWASRFTGLYDPELHEHAAGDDDERLRREVPPHHDNER